MTITRPIVIAVVAALALAGCTSPQAAPTPSLSSPSPTPTADPVDVSVIPENRFGVDCDAVVPPVDVATILGAEAPLSVPDRFDGPWSEVLIQDRALLCRWGAKNFLDGASPSIIVTAVPRGRGALDSVVSTYVPATGQLPPTEMGGVGDAAWSSCVASGSEAVHVNCYWTVAVADTWLTVAFLQLSQTEADITPVGDYGQLAATPRSDTASAAVVARAAAVIRNATAVAVPEPSHTARACETLADWQLLSDEVGLGTVQVESYDDSSSIHDLYSAVLSRMETKAAADRGAVRCFITFGDGAEVRETYALVRVVPDAGWIGSTTLWGGWGAESCHGWEGGPICELSGYAGDTATAGFAMIAGTLPDGMAARVLEAISAP